MGYFEVGVYMARHQDNLGTLWRSALQLGAAGMFTIGRPYRHQTADVFHAQETIPLRHYPDFDAFLAGRPSGAMLVGVEFGGIPLSAFEHPQKALYLLGSEDMGLPPRVLAACNRLVSLESIHQVSYNLAVAGSLVLYHRVFLAGKLPTIST
ncbi:MAG TPA: TrmH family RNA methyltransferase [Anaerolineaceae bacterium]|jgi:tRNA G18 (ribose-2'-O)-methylase SpoU